MLSTRFTELVGCRVPIQQAAMGGTATPKLAAAVSDAGGLGMVAAVMMSAEDLARELDGLRARTKAPFGVSFIVPFLHERELVEVVASRAKVVEFFFGTPDRSLVDTVHAGGALACWQVGSKEDAVAAEAVGCDLVVVQGVEAGGHVAGKIGLFPLLDEVLEVVKIPVIAAGGIGSGRTMAAALAAGASAVRMGTRFVVAEEADTHAGYAEKLIAARGRDTVITKAFHVMWPDTPHRVLRSALEAATAFQGEVTGELFLHGKKMPLPHWAVPNPTRLTTGNIDAMALYAGESVSAVKSVQPAATIVKEVSEQAESLLRQWASRLK
ncbi:NAD(P)H-dependent flavin oxidoreductase [Hyalangium rubrum]|uniref:Nitronate monooxygenase n=1 Tax=Hyalangium rubrum TaxID=3103134 RepID=A0ABU5H2S2_9BACT|nr:nitronate monooxygenase [Hyalangium sp. s54d21]MDY7227768.1 nitronate monooxygenase [Hyalangium sp. s54d21]